VHDVFGVDSRPHHDAHLRELGAHFAELLGEHALRGVELGGPIEQSGTLGMERSELTRAVRNAAVTGRIFDTGHGGFPLGLTVAGEAVTATLRAGCDTDAAQPVSANLAKNRYDEAGW
jgi:hypothetical protein